MVAPRNILMLAFPDAQLLDITGPLQMFAGANDELSRQAYHIQIAASEKGPFATSSGARLVADLSFAEVTKRKLARTHTLIAAGGNEGVRIALRHGAITQIIANAVGRAPRIASRLQWHSFWRLSAFSIAAAGGQSQFSAELAAQSSSNAKIRRLAERVTENPQLDWRMDALASEAGASKRSLSRSPTEFRSRFSTHGDRECLSSISALSSSRS
jgi:transcriptional regulator GlxA family with amidase domain